MATHSSILAWEIHGEEPGRLQSMGSLRVGHNLATKHHHHHQQIPVLPGCGKDEMKACQSASCVTEYIFLFCVPAPWGEAVTLSTLRHYLGLPRWR